MNAYFYRYSISEKSDGGEDERAIHAVYHKEVVVKVWGMQRMGWLWRSTSTFHTY